MGDTHQKELPTYQVSFGKEPCSCWALLHRSPGHVDDTHQKDDISTQDEARCVNWKGALFLLGSFAKESWSYV